MNRELAMKVANAVLYEGYMLYPYRPSAIKNRQRWSFGILYPPAYHEIATGTERSEMHSECLVRLSHPFANNGRKDGAPAILQVQLRFLHLMSREVGSVTADGFEPVPSLSIDGMLIEPSDESVERSVECELALRDGVPQGFPFSFAAVMETEALHGANAQVAGEIRRTQKELSGTISVSTQELGQDLVKLTVDVANTSLLPAEDPGDRDSALLGSLLSAHTILSITGGEFVSLLDPPEYLRQAVSECKNVGNFPVLVGAEGERDMMLCSPIVLYDYPQIAPESAGDFFDGTEMDEMLTLRVMTLTDEEKDQMRGGNDHVRDLLQRTEASAREQLMRTHGTIRSMKPVNEP